MAVAGGAATNTAGHTSSSWSCSPSAGPAVAPPSRAHWTKADRKLLLITADVVSVQLPNGHSDASCTCEQEPSLLRNRVRVMLVPSADNSSRTSPTPHAAAAAAVVVLGATVAGFQHWPRGVDVVSQELSVPLPQGCRHTEKFTKLHGAVVASAGSTADGSFSLDATKDLRTSNANAAIMQTAASSNCSQSPW
jgi:hypothetical protein